MHKNRLEAFSDGVIAIIITIMVLELKVPHDASIGALLPLAPVFLSYVMSFVYVGIYWNNHHHMFQAVDQVNGPILLANLHLLFWLSLFPFTTGWMGENGFPTMAVALYGLNLFCAAVSYYILARQLLAHHGPHSKIAKALGSDLKGKISIAIYILGIGLSFLHPWIGYALYVLTALMWLVPDKRFEKVLSR